MRTVIIGGGQGCRAIIKLAQGSIFSSLNMEILGVMDRDFEARGMIYARENGIMTTTSLDKLFEIDNIELIFELTGNDEVLRDIYKIIPTGARLIDHTFARVFWDLISAQEDIERQLREMTILEQKIEMEQHFLQGVFDNIPDMVAVLNRDRDIIKVNETFVSFTGNTTKDALGKPCSAVLHGTELAPLCDETIRLLSDVFTNHEPRSMVWKASPSKESYWEVTITPISDQYGGTEAALINWHRITEQVLLHRAIESAEQRFKSFIDSANDWISIKDLEGRYVIVNPAVAKAFHKKPEDFMGRTADEMLPGKIAGTVTKHDREVIEKDFHMSFDELIEIDGRLHHFRSVRFPLKDYKRSTIGVCNIMRDVTSEMELRDQLIQSTKLAALGKLAAGVAHEINNPLSGILAFAEDILEELPEGSPQKPDLEVIIRETLRCRDIVRNLLDFARQDKPQFEIVNPNLILEQAISLVAQLPQFRNIKINVDIQENIPSIQCDPHQIQQVIFNLMVNAADAMEESGRISIKTEYDRPNDKCVISVEDTGPGIPENLIDKIFEPFFSTKGTNGLGLAVSWGIVERHHGLMEVDMAESGGAVFKVILPTAEGND